jgi:DNA-binding transcriptional LysR family regulator
MTRFWVGNGNRKSELISYTSFLMRIDIDLRRLRFFVEVVRQGGFSHAAKVVFATQSTVSKAVKQLEGDLGVQLLDRSGHRSELTDAGKRVYDRGLRLLAAGEDLTTELDDLRGLKHGSLRIGFPRMGSSGLFGAAFASFRRSHPGIEVELAVHEGSKLEALLRSGELDLAALVHPLAPGFAWQDVRSDPLVVLLPRDHPLAARQTVRLDRLAQCPFILFEEGMALNDVILDACRKKGFVPNVAVHTGQIDFIFELVAAGVGIGFLPRVLPERRPHRMVRAVLLESPRCYWRLALAWRQGGYLSHAARAWLEHVKRDTASAKKAAG